MMLILTLLQPGAEISIDDWQVFREIFCISSRICSFNSGLLLKTLLLRYSQRKKSIGDKLGYVNVTSFGYPKISITEHNESLEV